MENQILSRMIASKKKKKKKKSVPTYIFYFIDINSEAIHVSLQETPSYSPIVMFLGAFLLRLLLFF